MHQQTNSRLAEIEPAITVKYKCHFQLKKGRKKLHKGEAPRSKPILKKPIPIPRITKMLSLAHYYQKLLDDGLVKNYAEIARLTGTSRPRLTQIMNLTLLAPEIQEKILNLSETNGAKTERRIRKIAGITLWQEQLRLWNS